MLCAINIRIDTKFGLSRLISLCTEQQDTHKVEVCVVDVSVPAYLAPGVVEPHLVPPDQLQHHHLTHCPLAPAAIAEAGLGPPVTVDLDKQSLVPERTLHS